ncbi:TonB-dependent receptor plug domain protein [Leptospira sp. P2653]|nr:TonB-dependent receptor plug domain protein [Leptospira sp. P2653]
MKQNVRLKDIPATVNIIDAHELKARSADQWLSAISYTPGIFANVERIEILKGPNSVLYGQGAMAGVINIISKKPQKKQATSFLLQSGVSAHIELPSGLSVPNPSDIE